jgi:hypothetical protein
MRRERGLKSGKVNQELRNFIDKETQVKRAG